MSAPSRRLSAGVIRRCVADVSLVVAVCSLRQMMGVVCVGIGADSLDTAFLYPSYPGAMMALGCLMVLFSPVLFFVPHRFKVVELRWGYLGACALAAFALIMGILSATKRRIELE